LGDVLHAVATGRLADYGSLGSRGPLRWRDGAAVVVVVASEGYPAAPVTGDVIDGIEAAESVPGVSVLHAGTALDADGRLVTAGGRVLGVTAVGADIATARASAYDAVGRLHIRGGHYRADIAAVPA
jgi:phosphoribosylamine---glycine ligase